jgi:hypothetical protein
MAELGVLGMLLGAHQDRIALPVHGIPPGARGSQGLPGLDHVYGVRRAV